MDKISQYELNRRTVQEGLKRRSDRLDAYEHDMIEACNRNCADAKKQRAQAELLHTAQVVSEEERRARAKERLHAIQEAHRQEQEATNAVNAYLITDLALLLLSVFTPLPFWAAITTALGMIPLLCAYLYRIFVPLDMEVAR
jgi:hypothetical protein